MSAVTIETCPLCGDQIQIKTRLGWPRRYKDVHGFCAEIGFSVGGWGQRQDFFPPFSGEVCPACWEDLTLIANSMADKIKALRGCRAVKVNLVRVEGAGAGSQGRASHGA